MRLALVSDVHLEFGDMLVPEEGDVLIVAGDLHTKFNATKWLELAKQRYNQVIYVLGNHEFYGAEINKIRNGWKEYEGVLDNGVTYFDHVRFLGTTLWTPALTDVGMNDYRRTKINLGGYYRRLMPQDTALMHAKAVDWLNRELAKPWDGETVVITHHAPIERCVRPHYIGQIANNHYHARLDDMIENNNIKYWFHGHMHDSIDFTYYNTRIVCNPRGYKGHELNKEFENPKILEI